MQDGLKADESKPLIFHLLLYFETINQRYKCLIVDMQYCRQYTEPAQPFWKIENYWSARSDVGCCARYLPMWKTGYECVRSSYGMIHENANGQDHGMQPFLVIGVAPSV
jgi:hypothetical protein